jgi:hypothetical protein
MVNLTVKNQIRVLDVSIHNGLDLTRSANGSQSDYTVSESSLMGAPTSYYVHNNDQRHMLDFLEESHKPWLVAVTTLIESPMKMYV